MVREVTWEVNGKLETRTKKWLTARHQPPVMALVM